MGGTHPQPDEEVPVTVRREGAAEAPTVRQEAATRLTQYLADQDLAPTVDLAGSETAPSAAPAGLAAGEGRYSLGDVVARGGMGNIISARDVNVRRSVAMKVLRHPKQAGNEDILRFVEEAQITGQLQHPSIVPLYELGIDQDDNVFYTMKFVEGKTLRDVLQGLLDGDRDMVREYPLSRLLTVFQKVCDAVAYAHSKGVVHRDLKPENIMTGEFGEVLVMDWGLAKILPRGKATPGAAPGGEAPAGGERDVSDIASVRTDEDSEILRTMAGRVMGTPRYMAPEQARGDIDAIDGRTDVYALGAILYAILALRPPVRERTLDAALEKVRTGDIPPPSAYGRRSSSVHLGEPGETYVPLAHCPAARVPISLEAVVMKAMALDRADRYRAVTDLQADIEAYQNGFATAAEHAGMLRQVSLFMKRHRRWVFAAVVSLALCGASLAVYVARERYLLRLDHDALVAEAVHLEESGELGPAVDKLQEARLLMDSEAVREWMASLLVASAKSMFEKKNWGAAAVSLQKAAAADPDNAEVTRLMPMALGIGFVTVKSRMAGRLEETFVDEHKQTVRKDPAGPPELVIHGTNQVQRLELQQGYHYLQWRMSDGRCICLPVEVERGEVTHLEVPFEELPEGYVFVHGGEFLEGNDMTVNEDGSLGMRRTLVPGFFIREKPVLHNEYMAFYKSDDYPSALQAVLAEHGLTVPDIEATASQPRDLAPHKVDLARPDRDMVRGISYYEAVAYARWHGSRLPTAQEWEKAVRGIDGRAFPTGDLPTEKGDPGTIYGTLRRDMGREVFTPYGCYAMTRNLRHWTSTPAAQGSPRHIVKATTPAEPPELSHLARSKELDAKTKYLTVGFTLCKDLPVSVLVEE